jgi:nucleoside-diphosphate-sugar epimerase
VKKTVLVSGGAGSVGRRVAIRLHREGHSVRVFDLPDLDYAGLEGMSGLEIIRGDITRTDSIRPALENVGAVIHLAAVLPPASEEDRDLTFKVNVAATLSLAEEMNQLAANAPFVFSSSVNTYGDTTENEPPVTVDRAQHGSNVYAESKIAAEKGLREICPHAIILRISGISVPEFMEPPAVWPFTSDQRIEFVHRDDVVTALCSSVSEQGARGQVFNVAGGTSWRKTGRSYVKDYYDLLGVPIEEASFQESPGFFDWYDTAQSQRVLRYQTTSYEDYLQQIRDEYRHLIDDAAQE